MPLTVYGHPFSSYTQKVLIALHEMATPFEFRTIGPETPQHVADWLARWPMAKFPILADGATTVAESSIIIEYLQTAHPAAVRLIPDDPRVALDVRFIDRYFDQYVMAPVQFAVECAMGRIPVSREDGLRIAAGKLEQAYTWLEQRLQARAWAAGADFTLADCAAAPALFYADWTHAIGDAHPTLRTYRARLLARPSFARCVEDARPLRHLFPLGAPARD